MPYFLFPLGLKQMVISGKFYFRIRGAGGLQALSRCMQELPVWSRGSKQRSKADWAQRGKGLGLQCLYPGSEPCAADFLTPTLQTPFSISSDFYLHAENLLLLKLKIIYWTESITHLSQRKNKTHFINFFYKIHFKTSDNVGHWKVSRSDM